VRLEGIIFDVDGVIAETENIHRKAYNAMFERVGIDVRWSSADYAARLIQVGRTKLYPVVEELDVADKAAYAQRLHGIKRGIYGEMLDRLADEGTLVPRPGVVRLIREAVQNGTRLGLATVSPRESSARLLRHVLGKSLLDKFGAFHTGCDVEHYKPAPDIYLQVVAQLSTDSAQTVAIEDTRHGLESAKSAGLKCVVTPSEYTVGEKFEGADLIVSDLDHFSGDRPVDLAVLNGLVNNG